MGFEGTATVRFHEVDRAGIVFFGRAFEYCHAVFEDLLAQVFGHPAAPFDRGGWGMPLVHAEADYSQPMKMGDRLRITLNVERLGESSITLTYTVRGNEDDLRARVKLVHVFVDLETFTPRGPPAELVEGLERLGLLPEVKPASA